ncbi:MAG: endonuclease/exonuclease/phosphatase family protein [Pontiellaceae bacterium]|nr:endonuclease/exonuclease/phosphatase family protein [Pontiellaceae bacterium]MBN2784364.1 endonuclease/exonuclease/phosphatase family protein [Pontiellaceae bacterium]
MIRQKKNRSRLLHYFDRTVWTLTTLLAVISLIGLAGKLHWALDLFSHFRVQYVQLALVFAGICLWVRRNRAAVTLILIGLFNYAFVYPLYLGKPDAKTAEPVRAMLMNILAANGNTQQVLEAIDTYKPDILLLEEVTPEWAAKLEKLNETYPYRAARPQSDCFGIMLLSMLPLQHAEVVEIGTSGLPSIMADVYIPDNEVFTLVGTHPLPPVSADYARRRNEQLAELPEIIGNQKHPVLLIGDLNTSPWSPWFRTLLRDSGLKNSMKGFGFQPSWPQQSPLLRIPIDHVLHDERIHIQHRMIGPDIGSDHFPVIVDFTLQP